MSKSPEDRYQTAGEMARALREAVGLAPEDTLQNTPLIALASAPKVEQIEHPTGSIITQEGGATMRGGPQGEATVWSPDSRTATISAPVNPSNRFFCLLGLALLF
jgi:hypothetical protein